MALMIAVLADTIFEVVKIPAYLTVVGPILINLAVAGALMFVLRKLKRSDWLLIGAVVIIESIPAIEVFPTWVALVLALKAGGRI
jgi:ABC-type anion transport system duplicated permease subunit